VWLWSLEHTCRCVHAHSPEYTCVECAIGIRPGLGAPAGGRAHCPRAVFACLHVGEPVPVACLAHAAQRVWCRIWTGDALLPQHCCQCPVRPQRPTTSSTLGCSSCGAWGRVACVLKHDPAAVWGRPAALQWECLHVRARLGAHQACWACTGPVCASVEWSTCESAAQACTCVFGCGVCAAACNIKRLSVRAPASAAHACRVVDAGAWSRSCVTAALVIPAAVTPWAGLVVSGCGCNRNEHGCYSRRGCRSRHASWSHRARGSCHFGPTS
jgi:hypothetical protein